MYYVNQTINVQQSDKLHDCVRKL